MVNMSTGSGAEEVTVYVLDDHEQVRRQLVALIGGAEGVRVVGSSEETVVALDEIVALRPDVAVLDGRVGDGDGLDICRQLALSAPGVRCVMVSAGVGVTWGPRGAAEAGAWAYLVKQLSDFPLVEVISRVGAGERLLASHLPSGVGQRTTDRDSHFGGANR